MADIDLSIDVQDDALFQSLNRLENELKSIDKQADKAGDSMTEAFKKSEKAVDSFNKELAQSEKAATSAAASAKKINGGLTDSLRSARSLRRDIALVASGGAFGAIQFGIQKVSEAFDYLNTVFDSNYAIGKRVQAGVGEMNGEFIKQVGTMDKLIEVAEDDTATKEDQQRAIKLLREQYSEYLPDLDKEAIGLQTIKENREKVIEGIAAELAAKQKARIAGEIVAEIADKEFQVIQIQKFQKELEKTGGIFNDVLASGLSTANIIPEFEIEQLKKQMGSLDDVEKRLAETLKDLGLEYKDLFKTTVTTKDALGDNKKPIEATKALQGSIADLEAQLQKVNKTIQEQTAAGDVTALTPLVEQAKTLEGQIQKANEALDRLRNPVDVTTLTLPEEVAFNELIAKGEEYSQREAERSKEELENFITLQEAKLRELQAADNLRLAQTGATEEEQTKAQEEQEKERRKLALETEKARLEYLIRFGELRTAEEEEAVKRSINAIVNEIALLNTAATEAATDGGKRKSLFSLLGIDPNTEEGQAAIKGIEQGVGIAIDNISNLLDANVQLAEKEVAVRNQRIDELRRQLDQELQLNEQGFASNVKNVQKQLAEEEKARQKALEQQKKARTAQLALETITQATNLITAASQIFNTFAALPFGIGIPIAAGVIAAMVGSFIAFKVQAFKAARLETGGRIPTRAQGGRTDKAGGAGHRIEDTNIVVGAGEWVINEDSSERHDQFLERLNKGEFDHVDLNTIVEGKGKRIKTMSKTSKIVLEQQRQEMMLNISEAVKQQTKEILGSLLPIMTAPRTKLNPDGSMLETRTDAKGNTFTTLIKTNKK